MKNFRLFGFLVIFPFVVLLAFYKLVSKHHVKLYAPQDYPDKEGFFRVLSPSEQKKKLDDEIRSIEEGSIVTVNDHNSNTGNGRKKYSQIDIIPSDVFSC